MANFYLYNTTETLLIRFFLENINIFTLWYGLQLKLALGDTLWQVNLIGK